MGRWRQSAPVAGGLKNRWSHFKTDGVLISVSWSNACLREVRLRQTHRNTDRQAVVLSNIVLFNVNTMVNIFEASVILISEQNSLETETVLVIISISVKPNHKADVAIDIFIKELKKQL